MCTACLLGGYSPRPVYYFGSVHLLCSAYLLVGSSHIITALLRGCLLHMCYHVLRCCSRECPTFHDCERREYVCFSCGASLPLHCCTLWLRVQAAVRGTLLETAPGLCCGVGALGRQFGSAQPALPVAWRFWAPLVVLLPVVADAAAASGASLLGALLSFGLVVLV